jgi:transglutaminase-like putative cysteine protease
MEFMALPLPEDIDRLEKQYRWADVEEMIRRYLAKKTDQTMRKRLEYEMYRIRRYKKMYRVSEEQALTLLTDAVRDFTIEEFTQLKKQSRLDFIETDGGILFEKRFLPNLFFAEPSFRERRLLIDEARERAKKRLESRLDQLLEGSAPYNYRVTARIRKWIKQETLAAIKEESHTLRCWLPFPLEDLQQTAPVFERCSEDRYVLSTGSSSSRTIFFERSEVSDKEFFVEFSYTISESIREIDADSVLPYSGTIDSYLKEEAPHILFTPYLRFISEEILGNERNPYKKAKKIYDWITRNVFYSFMKEYRVYENISHYGAVNKKGDCGVQALLFITLCRMNGIPARWQSGWYANPEEPGNHDWALFYVEPYGWLPVDCSFGGARRENEPYRHFYFGNLDAYRMVASRSYLADFSPSPIYLLNDPYDNQTGEIQTDVRALEPEETESKIEILSFEKIDNSAF